MIGAHPSEVELHDFLLGKLLDQEYAAVEAHLSFCEECVAKGAGACSSDTFVELLAAAGMQLVGERSDTATPARQDTQSMLSGMVARGDPALRGPAIAPPSLADHPRYTLLRRLGIGGMGSVWLAEHLMLKRVVAIKAIRPEFLAKPESVERFRREARAVAKLSHPNIVAAFDAEEAGGVYILVMEYVAGENLGEILSRGALPLADACRAVRDAALGLAHAHACGLVHRDIKPHNLIRATDGATKILDFGLAMAEAGCRVGLTSENMVLGTPDYIAPEQARDARAADARSDIYSLGCTLFALLAGRAPFAGGTVLAKLDAHRHDAVPEVPNVPKEIAALARKMMAKRPNDRPTATEIVHALEPYCSGRACESPTAGTRSARQRQRRWGIIGGLLAMAALLGASVVYKIQSDNQEIVIETNDPDVKVVMRRNGELVRIVDTKTEKAWNLDTKTLRLKPHGSELAIDLPGKEPLLLRRQGDAAITIRWRPASPMPRAVPDTVPPAEPTLEAYRVLRGHAQRTKQAIFSSDSKTVYSCGDNGFVRVWDVESGRETGKFDNGDWVKSISLIDDGKALIAQTETQLKVWNLVSGKESNAFPMLSKGDRLERVAVSPDGQKVAAGSLSGAVRIWDVPSRKLESEWPADPALATRSVAWTPDGKQVVAGMHETLALFDYPSGRRVHRVWKFRTILEVGVTPDGLNLIGIHWDGGVEVYDSQSGQMLSALDVGTTGNPRAGCIAVLSNERIAVGGRGHCIDIWDLPSATRLATFRGHTEPVLAVTVSPDRKFLVSSSHDSTVRLWRLPENGVGTREPPLMGEIVPPNALTLEAYRVLRGHTQRTRHAIFSPDNKTVYSCGDDGFVRVWEVETGRESDKFDNGDWVLNIGLIDHGRTLMASTQSQLKVWNLVTGRESDPFPKLTNGDRLTRAAISPDGRKVAAGSASGTVRIWDIPSRKLESEWPADPALATYSVAWSPDGRQLVAGMHETLALFDYPTGKRIHRIWEFRTIIGVGFTPDGENIVAFDWDAAIHVYDRQIGRKREEFFAGLIGNLKTVDGAVLTNERIVAVGRGYFIDVWDWPSATRRATCVGHTAQVLAATPSEDRQFLASAGEDSTVRIWKLPESVR
jgi:WD40 repeat protein